MQLGDRHVARFSVSGCAEAIAVHKLELHPLSPDQP
jgi:hypothetical protein